MVHSRLDQLAALPSLPTVAVEILKSLNHPDTAILQLVDLVQADPALAAKVLEAANSARYNTRQVTITRLDRAMLLLGKQIVCSLALNISIVQATLSGGEMADEFQRYWLESFIRAIACEWCAQRTGSAQAVEAYTIGLLSIIGRLVLLKHCPDDFIECTQEARQREVPVEVVESERKVITSADLTISLLQRWKFDPLTIKAIRLSAEQPQAVSPGGQPALARSLEVAALLGRVASGSLRSDAAARLEELFDSLPFDTPHAAASLILHVLDQLMVAGPLFNIHPSQTSPLRKLLTEMVPPVEDEDGEADAEEAAPAALPTSADDPAPILVADSAAGI